MGIAHATGESPTVITDTPKAVSEAGKVHATGSAPTVVVVRPVPAVEVEENRGGGHFYDELDEQLRKDDELILEMIREFIRRIG